MPRSKVTRSNDERELFSPIPKRCLWNNRTQMERVTAWWIFSKPPDIHDTKLEWWQRKWNLLRVIYLLLCYGLIYCQNEGTAKENNVEWFRSNCLSIQSMTEREREREGIERHKKNRRNNKFPAIWWQRFLCSVKCFDFLNTNQPMGEERRRWKNWVNCNKQNFYLPSGAKTENIIQLISLFFGKGKAENDGS